MLSDEYDLLSSELMVAAYVQGLQQTLSSESNSSFPSFALRSNDSTTSSMPIEEEQSAKQLKPNTQTSIHLDDKTFVPLKILSFNGLDLSNNPHQYYKNKHTAGYPGDANSLSPVFKYSNDSTHAHEELDEIIYEHCWNKKNTSSVKCAPQM